MAESVKIISIFWKFHYLKNSKFHKFNVHKGFQSTLNGHAALLIYKYKNNKYQILDSMINNESDNDYPFTPNFLEDVSCAFNYDKTIDDIKNNSKTTTKEKFKEYLKKIVCNDIKEGSDIEKNKHKNESKNKVVNYLSNIKILSYISWMPGGGDPRSGIKSYWDERPALHYGINDDCTIDYDFKPEKSKAEKSYKISLNTNSANIMLEQALNEFIDYNTYEKENRLQYNKKKDKDTPYIRIPTLTENQLGLDHEKMVFWWLAIGNSKKHKYIFATENCCKIVAKCLHAGGANDYYSKSNQYWNPYTIYNYSKKISNYINQSNKKINFVKAKAWKNIIINKKHLLITQSKFHKDTSENGYFSWFYGRNKELINIDNILGEIGRGRYLINGEIHAGDKLSYYLISLKESIAKILYEDPETKFLQTLYSLLIQCDYILNKINEDYCIRGEVQGELSKIALINEGYYNYETNYNVTDEIFDKNVKLGKKEYNKYANRLKLKEYGSFNIFDEDDDDY